jgi:hypothetical protein
MNEEPTNFLAICWAEFKKRRHAKREAEEKAAIARAFNNRYTYQKEYLGLDALAFRRAWMCPSCNKVHPVIGHSVFDGIHYPQCCEYPQGNRHHMGIEGGIKYDMGIEGGIK